MKLKLFLKKTFRRTSVLSVGPLIPLFWTSGDICRGLPGWIPHVYASSPACGGFLRFTSGVTPTDLLVSSIAAAPFYPHTCTHLFKHWWDSNLELRVPPDALPYKPSRIGYEMKCYEQKYHN